MNKREQAARLAGVFGISERRAKAIIGPVALPRPASRRAFEAIVDAADRFVASYPRRPALSSISVARDARGDWRIAFLACNDAEASALRKVTGGRIEEYEVDIGVIPPSPCPGIPPGG